MQTIENYWFSFGIDIVSLYATLKHDLVMKALEDVMECCPTDWSNDFRTWSKNLMQLSFDAGVLKNYDQWQEVDSG